MKTDPTDTGGLFVGRRPGTAPMRYRHLPERGSRARGALRRVLAALLLGMMVFVCLLFWGPIPAGVAVGRLAGPVPDRQRQPRRSSSGSSSCCFVLLAGLVVLRRLDETWILVRRAAGHDQRTGVMARIFAYTAIAGAILFSIWFLLINGPGSSSFSNQYGTADGPARLLQAVRGHARGGVQRGAARAGAGAPRARSSRASSRSTSRARRGPSTRRRTSSTRSRTPRGAGCTATSTATPASCAPSSRTATASRRGASRSATGRRSC